jgi:hypothetical protein
MSTDLYWPIFWNYKSAFSMLMDKENLPPLLAVLNGCFWQFDVCSARAQISFPSLRLAPTRPPCTQDLKELNPWLQGKPVN